MNGASMPDHIGYGGVIARFAGKAFVAAGFILGIYGLTEKQDAIMQTGLGLLAAGVAASAYGLYHWVRWKGVTTDQDGPHRS
jgi:hypothetical protein